MVQTSERFQAIFSKLHYDVITAVITALQHLPEQLFLSVLPRQYFRGHCLNNILIASYVNGWGRNFVTKNNTEGKYMRNFILGIPSHGHI